MPNIQGYSRFTMYLSQIVNRYKGLIHPLGTFAFYFMWIWFFKLLILSFVTYFMLPPAARLQEPHVVLPRFEEISDVLGANELPLIGLGSFLFVAFLRALHPLTETTTRDIFRVENIRKSFSKGAVHGLVLALGITIAFFFSGIYGFFGFSIQAEELSLALPGLILRTITILFFVYCEEFIFRKKILSKCLTSLPETLRWRGVIAILITSLLYCLVKLLQFDLGILQTMTLFILSFSLSLKVWLGEDFSLGAGFWGIILIVFQPLLGLPIFGTEFSGIFLVKYQPEVTNVPGLTKLLTGGIAGPLSALAFQFLLLLDLARSVLKNKKDLLPKAPNR